MLCRSQHCWELLYLLAHHCQCGCNNFNLVGPTMLGAVAFVCACPNEQLVDWLDTVMRTDEGKGRCKGNTSER